jgi:hypothetical protein
MLALVWVMGWPPLLFVSEEVGRHHVLICFFIEVDGSNPPLVLAARTKVGIQSAAFLA